MGYLQQIQRGIDFIEAHLDEELDVIDIAKAARMSRWHFQRIFKALTNETLKAYIRARRLAESRERLTRSEMRIIDIAMHAGFQSQAAFTRAFKQAYGLTPLQYRKRGHDRMFLQKIQIDREYLKHINHNVSLTPTFTTKPEMQLVGIHTTFFGVDSEKNNMADKLPALWDAFLERLPEIESPVPGTCYGIIQTSQDTEELDYYACIEVKHLHSLPRDMHTLTLPSTLYAVFSHKGKPQNLDHTVNYIYSNWLLNADEQHTYAPDIEIYGPKYIADSEESEIHYAIPVVS